jgi:hypothetical protein
MAWYSNVSDFAAKQLSAFRGPHPDGGDEHGHSALDGAPLNGRFLVETMDGETGNEAIGTGFLRPSGMNWAPSEADAIYEAFDVSQPVAQPEDLRGREKQLKQLLSGVLHRRNHGVISGPRGSGKTSLARVFGQCADLEGVVVLYAACDDGTSFGELIRDFLEQIPSSSVDADYVEVLEQRVANFGPDSSPHQATSILAQIKYSQLVIIVDEFDRVTDRVMHTRLASLLKLISDARLPVRFVLVGGSRSFADVVGQHPSLVRHLTRLSTEPLSSEAIHQLLDSCAQRCGMSFSDDAKRSLDEVSCGSPYHARLFSMHAALWALARNSREISDQDVSSGLIESFDEWASLNREDAATFRSIIDGAHGNPARLVEVARQLAAADEDSPDGHPMIHDQFGSPDVRDEILEAFGHAIKRTSSGFVFRDATAPQFLLVLHKLAREAQPAKRKEHAGA